LVSGPHFLGYLTEAGLEPPKVEDCGAIATGDIGELDGDGFLTVTGRIRNVIITSHGRNVSPEWIESELTAYPQVLRAFVYGDGDPQPSAALVVDAAARDVEAIVRETNRNLPDYARLAGCVVFSDGALFDEWLDLRTGAADRVAASESFAACFTNLLENPEADRWAFTVNS
jgi:acyl-CoA synthetase (AMP-forming)/AMP-acid ligase II